MEFNNFGREKTKNFDNMIGSLQLLNLRAYFTVRNELKGGKKRKKETNNRFNFCITNGELGPFKRYGELCRENKSTKQNIRWTKESKINNILTLVVALKIKNKNLPTLLR